MDQKNTSDTQDSHTKKRLKLSKSGQKISTSKPTSNSNFNSIELENDLQSRIDEWNLLIESSSIPRVQKRKKLSFGEFVSELNLIKLDVIKGKWLSSMGFNKNGVICLHPEEALFLADWGLLEVRFNGLACSLQELIQFMLIENVVRTNEYLAYSHLKKLGFIVTRTKCYQNNHNETNQLVDNNSKNNNDNNSNNNLIVFDIYKQSQNYKKTANNAPFCRLCVVDFSSDFFTLSQIENILSISESIPVKVCIVCDGQLSFIELSLRE